MNTPLTEAEQRLYFWQYGTGGSFTNALFEAMCVADSINLARLGIGFPEEVAVFLHYKMEPGYWEQLCHRARPHPLDNLKEQ